MTLVFASPELIHRSPDKTSGEGSDEAGFRQQLVTLANQRNYEPVETQIVGSRCDDRFVVGRVQTAAVQDSTDLAWLGVDCAAG